MVKTLTVAAVQMACLPGEREHNLQRATSFIEHATDQGAELILLPELFPSGYMLTEAIWDWAEPFDGPTTAWLQATAQRLNIYLGTSFLEAEGEDFYNTFVLVKPGGDIAGRVRKAPPASIEAYFYRAGDGPHVIETPLGNIGINLCYENLLAQRLVECHQQSVDLVLQPTSAATPLRHFPLTRRSIARYHHMLKHAAEHWAGNLGVPVILANKCGPLNTPLPGGFPAQNTSFPGYSTIVDGDASVKTQLDDREGFIVSEVTLDPERKTNTPPKIHGRWAIPVPWFAFIWPISQRMGEKDYARNPRRRTAARKRNGCS